MCGSEVVLVDEVVDLIRTSMKTDSVNMCFLDVRDTTERNVWNELRQLPFGMDVNRVTIVRGAENIKDTESFVQYIKDRGALPRNYVVFVSAEPTIRKDEKNETWSPLDYLKTRGAVVECKPFTAATAKHAVTWVMQKAEIRGSVAEHMLNRATGDLRLVRDTINKLKVFPGEITLRVVSDMFEERPGDTFLGALFSLDRKTALKALKEVPRDDYSKTLGLVDARLDLAGLVHDLLIEHKSSGEIAKIAGNKGFLVPDMLPVAKHYDKRRRLRIRKFLATVDEYSNTGIPDGALEALIALW